MRAEENTTADGPTAEMTLQTAEQIQGWLVARVAARKGIDVQTLDARERLSRYGVSSLEASSLLAELSSALGRLLSPALVWEHPNPRVPFAISGGEASEPERRARPAVRSPCPWSGPRGQSIQREGSPA